MDEQRAAGDTARAQLPTASVNEVRGKTFLSIVVARTSWGVLRPFVTQAASPFYGVSGQRRLRLSGSRVRHAAQEEDSARLPLNDHEDEGSIDRQMGRWLYRRAGFTGHDHGGGGGLGAFLVDRDRRPVEGRRDVEIPALSDAAEIGGIGVEGIGHPHARKDAGEIQPALEVEARHAHRGRIPPGRRATWLLYAALVDLTAAVAEQLQQPYHALSMEMVYRGLYHYTQAYHRGDASDPVAYLAAHAEQLGILKRPRRSSSLVLLYFTTGHDP